MKIFNFIKKTRWQTTCTPIAAHNLQEAYELFFKSKNYTIEVDQIEVEDKDQFKLFDMDKLEAEWKKVGEEN